MSKSLAQENITHQKRCFNIVLKIAIVLFPVVSAIVAKIN
jgi:hypothetical protein